MLKLTIREDGTYRINEAPLEGQKATDAEQLVELMRADIKRAGDDREHLVAVFMDRKFQMICHGIIFSGDYGDTTIQPNVLARHAILAGADLVAIGHNHPSGSRQPSKKDMEGTVAIQKFLETVDLTLTNSFVIGDGTFSDCINILDLVELHKLGLIKGMQTAAKTEKDMAEQEALQNLRERRS